MKTDADRIRRELAARNRRRGRLPDDLRDRAYAYVVARRAAGLTLAQIAEEVGLAVDTVGRWTRPKTALATPSVLLPVNVVDVPKVDRASVVGPVVVTPNGLRIEGLTFDQIVALVGRHG